MTMSDPRKPSKSPQSRGPSLSPAPLSVGASPLLTPQPKKQHQPSGAATNYLQLEEGVKQQNTQLMCKKIDTIATHMTQQLSEHEMAMKSTQQVFNALLDELPKVKGYFKTAFQQQALDEGRIYTEIDPDRSIGILNILWHTITFTTRANTKPLALFRQGNTPLFTGRILAMRGDFQDISYRYETQQFSDLLPFELASLFVPASPYEPAILKIPHMGQEELYVKQEEASDVFLMKCIEMVCGGGFLHEE